MTSERWLQVEALYHLASEKEPSTRSMFLDEACGGNEELRRQVQSLLDTGSRENIVDHPVWEAMADLSSTSTPIREGVQLGIYRTEARLGAGGMGEVFRAVDTRLDRRVAIKVCARDSASVSIGKRELWRRSAIRTSAHCSTSALTT
jgi:eukaryotic-like serine/threonine-protein kinase